MSSRLLQLVGGAMALLGVAILAFAVYSYIDLRRTEDALESQIPGQNPSLSPTPILLLPSLENGPRTASNPVNTGAPVAIAAQPSPKLAGEMTATPTAISLSPGIALATPIYSLPNETATPTWTATPTAISLAPVTLLPTDSSDVQRRSSLPSPAPTHTPFPTIAIVPTPQEVPTVQPVEQTLQGVPRGSGPIATRLVIPRLNLDLAIRPSNYITFEYNGQLLSDWNIPFDAAGHLITTAQPGENGNAVLSGHHNLVAINKFGLGTFAGLWNLAEGDEVRVQTEDSKVQLWRVTQSYPIKEGGEPLATRIEHAREIMSDTPGPRLTLLTCWNGQSHPLSGNTYRWVVTAELISIS